MFTKPCYAAALRDLSLTPDIGSALDSHVFVESLERISHYVQFMSELLDHGVNAGHVPQHTHTLCVRVVAHSKRTPDGLSKFPVEKEMSYKCEINSPVINIIFF